MSLECELLTSPWFLETKPRWEGDLLLFLQARSVYRASSETEADQAGPESRELAWARLGDKIDGSGSWNGVIR